MKKRYTVDQVDAYIERALNTLQIAENRIDDARAYGIEVDTYFDIDKTREKLLDYREKIHKAKRGLGVSNTTIAYLKEAASKTYYDRLIKYEIEIPDEARSTNNMRATKKEVISQYDINALRRKQVNDSDSLNETQIAVLSKWSAATELSSDFAIPELDTPQQERRFIKGFNITRDVSFGGSSMLLNKLAYTYDAVPTGREFVTWLQNVMKDPQVFVQIEKWFRMNYNVQQLIDGAINKEWYKNFKSFSMVIVEFVDSLSSTLNINIPDNIREKYEADMAEYYDSF